MCCMAGTSSACRSLEGLPFSQPARQQLQSSPAALGGHTSEQGAGVRENLEGHLGVVSQLPAATGAGWTSDPCSQAMTEAMTKCAKAVITDAIC